MTDAKRPRILIVTRNLPPLVGGMERLNWHMAEELARVADVRIVGPVGSAAMAPAGIAVREAPLKPLWKFLLHARTLALHEARAWQPDMVLAGSGLTAPIARAAARTCKAKTAVYAHGLDIAVKHPVYRAIWLPALRRMDRVIANSHATAALCRGIGIDPARIGIVHPGVDLPVESQPLQKDGDRAQTGLMSQAVLQGTVGRTRSAIPLDPPSQAKGEEVMGDVAAGGAEDSSPLQAKGEGVKGDVAAGAAGDSPPSAGRGSRAARGDAEPLSLWEKSRGEGTNSRHVTQDDFRQRHHLANRPLLLSVGRLSARKGLCEFVANALPQIAAAHPDVILLIVGDAPSDALNTASQTTDEIRAVAARVGLAGNVCFLGRIADNELAAAYCAADVHVFPVREIPGDPEGFGMVAVESAAHGLPTVAFASGGVPDAVVEGETGSLITPEDYAAFAATVNAWLARTDRATVAARCMAATEKFDWQHFGEHLRALLALPDIHAPCREK